MRSAGKNSCAAIMRDVEVNPYVRVKVNGAETDFPVGSTIGQIVKQSPLQNLVVMKPKGAKLFPVNWHRGARDILNLTLEGGEEIKF
jgi:hypothetical protein